MKKNWLCLLCLVLVTMGLCLTQVAAAAQNSTPAAPADPKIVIVISLQQSTLRITEQVHGVLEISNQADTAADDSSFRAILPDFLVMHVGSCNSPAQDIVGALILGNLPAHSVKTQPFCITLDNSKARSGSFNVLFEVTYSWGTKTDMVTAEKALGVDLIGSQTILGLPLAFAGFILPGLMLLIALRWFKAPWAVGLSGEDRLIYSVLLSLLLLGPFAWLGSQAGAPGWAQFLNFSQEVTIERLGAYVLIGLVFGAVIGAVYQRIKQEQARQLAALKPTINDDNKTLIQKALLLNRDYHGGIVSFRNKQKGSEYIGAHFAEMDGKLYIFSEFRLNADQLDTGINAKLRNIIGTATDFGKNRSLILRVLDAIQKPAESLIQVSNPVMEYGADKIAMPVNPDLAFVELDRADYSAPMLERNDENVLLDISF